MKDLRMDLGKLSRQGLLFIVLLVTCAGCAVTSDKPLAGLAAEAIDQTAEQKLGIEVVAIRRSAAGYMLDFRYRAVDPEKAAILFDRQTKPYLIHERTGARFLVPAPAKVGALRQTTNKPVAGRSYFMMFANPGNYVQSGDLVTIVFGNYLLEHLTVE